jgi:eukaryotic-like serine/threonine-protein kinase
VLTLPPLDLQTSLAGRYRLERELGRGGMATVYLAHDLRHDRPVALKVLRPELSGVLGSERFTREIALAARLSHRHILPIHDSGTLQMEAGGPVLYYTMPFVAGRSVRDRLDAEPQLPVEEAVRIARQVAEALNYAHEQGIIHRDIKPENILLTGNPSRDRGAADASEAVVADFGIARVLDAAGGDRLTESGLALGTPAYMSPEQGTGSTRLDGRTDVYALGCVLYEMLAGQPPFTGPTAQAVLARHAIDPVPSLRTVRSTVSQELSRVVHRALAKVPADRYPSAGAFAEALAAPGVGTTHETVTVLTPVRDFRRRRMLMAGGVGLLAAVAIAVVTTARSRDAKPVTVDPALVAVAPFRVAAADASLGYLREGMVDLLASKLGGTLALRPADPRASLGAWRRAAGGGDLTESAALAAAAQLGAGRLVQGEVVGDRGHVTLSAVLVDVPGGRARARSSVDGPSDSLSPLVNELTARLLSLAAGEPDDRLAALAAVPLPALRAYLDGQVLLRRSEPFTSLKRFQDALAGDSGFALAALGAVRARLEGQSDQNGAEARAAWRLRNRLSPRDQAKLDVLLGSSYPQGQSAADAVGTAERYTQLAPDDPDAWYLYGVRLCSSGPMLDLADARPRCKSAYGRALGLDSSSTLILMNYTSVAASLRDSAAMTQGLRALLRSDSTSPGSVFMQWKVATMLGDTAGARRAALNDSMITTRASGRTQFGPWSLTDVFLQEGVGLHDVELVLERSLADAPTETQRGNLTVLKFELALARGRSTGVPPAEFWPGAGRESQRVIDALFADGDPAPAVPAAHALERAVGTPIGEACCLDRFVAGESALEGGRITTARRALSDLERVAGRGSDTAAAAVLARAYAAILAAQLSARDRSPSAAERLRVLDSIVTDPRDESAWVPLLGNLIAARLHEQRKQFPEALAAIRRRDEQSVRPVYVTYHREEGRIAAEAGDTAGAIQAYQRYLRIRDGAEPRLRPEVERVRGELAAIDRVSASR